MELWRRKSTAGRSSKTPSLARPQGIPKIHTGNWLSMRFEYFQNQHFYFNSKTQLEGQNQFSQLKKRLVFFKFSTWTGLFNFQPSLAQNIWKNVSLNLQHLWKTFPYQLLQPSLCKLIKSMTSPEPVYQIWHRASFYERIHNFPIEGLHHFKRVVYKNKSENMIGIWKELLNDFKMIWSRLFFETGTYIWYKE